MSSRFLSLIALLCLASALHAQVEKPTRFQLYGGYSYLSNSLNGVPGSQKGLNGWEGAMEFPSWHGLRFKVDATGYSGTNLNAPEHPYFIMGGPHFGWRFGRETIFVDGLGGDGGVNRYWGANKTIGATASFVGFAGGGVDSRITRRISFRVAGGYQYSYFALSTKYSIPYRIPGLPTNFAHVTSGLVWKF
jgi:hypothetical protein